MARRFFVKVRKLKAAVHFGKFDGYDKGDMIVLTMAEASGLATVEGREAFVYPTFPDLATALGAIRAKDIPAYLHRHYVKIYDRLRGETTPGGRARAGRECPMSTASTATDIAR